MKTIKLTYLSLLLGLSLLWVMADDFSSALHAFRALQLSMINFTGLLAIGCMSAGMLLAMRPTRVEPFLGGLDKTYRLHRWLGISALVLAIVHWLWVKMPNWFVGLGWMQKPLRKTVSSPGETLPAVAHFLATQHGLARSTGEWAFYGTVVLALVALLKSFPYRHFFKTHRLMAVVYPALGFHAIVLMKPSYWNAAIGPVVGLLVLAATLAAAVSLLRRVGHTRRAVGVIESLVHYRDMRVLSVAIKLRDRWLGHAAGQFAFVTFDAAEGAHPFTISSSWYEDGMLRFHIKGIGDYTEKLPETLKTGGLVTVEGPYGAFDFCGNKPRQIWIAGGIGITPFLARMQARARHADEPDARAVDLFYSTNAHDEEFIGAMRQLATGANVRLHVLVSGKDDRLTATRLCEIVPAWTSADVWFCGPAAFGRALREDLVRLGLAQADFHQELFDMR
ncbi:ferric reductase-like transmembrane domain-containing protein [Paraburkholderia sp. SIMBA_054]|uniref:ferredoxin reductase family protein n=1 Tax=Paraburkholderia sp. SIMBA_054 TaxID=3085795 RepID=UPI00397A772B